MNKKQIIITPDVIEDCLFECLDTIEKKNPSHSSSPKKSTTLN